MKNAIYIYIVTVSLALCAMAGIACAQGSQGDTSISYDDQTGTVTAYGDTTNDLDATYAPQASVSVVDQNNVTVASGFDYELYDNASVSLQFAATPGSTYTAVTNHCFRLQYWSYDNVYPYQQSYYDDWNMSSFLGQNIYSPLDYWFASPGYTEIHRPTNFFCVGKTYDTVEAAPKVQISGPSGADDGTTVTFTSTVDSGHFTVTGYQWSFTTPSGSGNSPDLSFTAATSQNTNATAKWFANPDNACTAALESTYTVKLIVSFSDHGDISKTKTFKPAVTWDPGGVTSGHWSITGSTQKAQNGSGQWYIAAIGTYNITTFGTVAYNVPTSSQFRSKTENHEGVHVAQWQPTGLLGSQVTNTGLWNAIKDLTASTQVDLVAATDIAATNYGNTASTVSAGACNQAEVAAYAVSDTLAPQYLYQACGRTTFANCH
jgi:hypothetical protein